MCDSEKLIFLIETRPALYNNNLKEHSDRKIVEKLWEEIATEMNSTASECKNKWTILRNSYARSIRDEWRVTSKKKKTWYLADAMSFLKGHMALHKCAARNLADTSDDSTSAMSLKYESITTEDHEPAIFCTPLLDQLTDSIPKFSPIFVKNEPIATDEHQPPIQCTPTLEQFADTTSKYSPSYMKNEEPTRAAKPKRTTSQERLADSIARYLEQSAYVEEDANLIFFKSLIPDMSRLPKRKQRNLKEFFLQKLNHMLDEEDDNRAANIYTAYCAAFSGQSVSPEMLGSIFYTAGESFS